MFGLLINLPFYLLSGCYEHSHARMLVEMNNFWIGTLPKTISTLHLILKAQELNFKSGIYHRDGHSYSNT